MQIIQNIKNKFKTLLFLNISDNIQPTIAEGINIPYRRIPINKCRKNEDIKISVIEHQNKNCSRQDSLTNDISE